MKFLIHITCGPENPSKAAQDEGHEVRLFLAAEAAVLLRPAVVENLQGLGTGSLKAHLEALRAGGASFYVSGMSAKSRGFDAAELGDLKAEFAMPAVLVRLAAEADRVLCY